jgi:crotonobetainyl-CoA:carnitine CoA-transferase CaiB-like acyl-CoA transferase
MTMKLLDGVRVLAWKNVADGALARFLQDLGAQITRCENTPLAPQLQSADFLLEDLGLGRLSEMGLSRAQIEAANPRLIHVSVTTFGSVGPRSNWRGSELVASATGGILRLIGDVDRAPVKEALDACGFHADMVAAVGALAAFAECRRSGIGQHVDISTQEVAFSRNVNGVLVWQFDRRLLQRAGGALNYGQATVRCIWALLDGFCFHSLMTGRFGAPANQGLSDWMDECGADNPLAGTDWLRYNRSTLDPAIRARWESAIAAFFKTRSRDEVENEGRKRGINATVLAAPADVFADDHLISRRFWRSTEQGPQPGRFLSVRAADEKFATDAPPVSATRGPLAGVRVLDFSWALVGSITTKTLGDLGCEIIKLESRTRPCLSRLDVQVSASQAGNLDDKPWFAHLNTSKLSLALDLKQPASREVLDPLIDWADVVVENFSPGTLEKLGLDYPRLAARNPRIVMVSGSVYGQTGPLAKSWGVDGTGAALSGRTLLTGWPDRGPSIPSAAPYGDVILPYAMAAAVIAALEHRALHHRGCHIDASMYELCVQQMRDAFVPGAWTGRMGNSDPRVFHQGVYATSGDDRWVAITFHTLQDWQKFAQAEGIEAADTPARDAALARWCRARADAAAAEHLQQIGVAAGAVQDMSDLFDRDPQLKARGSLVTLDHPLLGHFGHVKTPIAFSRSSPAPFRAPSMGEHDRRIATGLCGLSSARFEELEKLGVFR